MRQELEETPRYVYIFNDEIEPDSVQNLIDILYNYPSVDLYFSSEGGYVYLMDALMRAMNQHGDLRVYLTYQVMSAGTDILFDFIGEIFIEKELEVIMFHNYSRALPEAKPGDIDFRKLRNHTKLKNANYYKKLEKLGLSKKELNLLKKGGDVFWYREDFDKLIAFNPLIKYV